MKNDVLPLAGIRVLEFGQVLSAPFGSRILADLGAEVIKIERPEGDDSRRMGPAFQRGDALNFHVFNRNKKSVAVDLTGPAREHLDELIASVDVLIHNMRPGTMEKHGLDGATLCARYPRLICCEISAFGHLGPLGMAPGYEPLIQAFSGLSTINGNPDDPPVRLGVAVCDQGVGMWAVIGILSLLQRRHQTGHGGLLNTSLLETALVWGCQHTDAILNTGVQPQRHGSGHPNFVTYQSFQTADRPFLVCVGNDRLFAKFAQALGRPHWTTDPRFSDNRARLIHKDILIPLIEEIFPTQPCAHWLTLLGDAGVPCTPINTIPEVLDHAQVAAMGQIQTVPGEGTRFMGLPLSIDGVRPPIRSVAPTVGQHTAEFLDPP